MLLRSEDKAKFDACIEQADSKVWASYSIKGNVKGEAVTQSDKRMFASEVEARGWLIGEAKMRGFPNFESEIVTR
jgi:hypothetical protein